MKRFIEISRLVLALAAMLGVAYIFTMYLDGDIGVVVWSFLLIAPLLSLLLAWLSRKRITVELDAPAYAAKGKNLRVRLRMRSCGRLPVPFVRCRIAADGGLLSKDPRPVQSCMTGRDAVDSEHEFTARHGGCARLSAREFSVSDYLGLFRFAVQGDLPSRIVGVIPEIPSLTGAGVMLHAVTDTVLTQDEDEEESSAAFSSVSAPGYIHRDYVPGDNLRRINWKLSAKRNRLMVRMDEAAATVRPSVILDLRPEQDEEGYTRRDILMEGALGFLLLLVRQGIATTLRYANDGEWHCLILENEDAVRSAAVELSTADLICGSHRLDPDALSEKAGAYLIYTAHPDEGLVGALEGYRSKGYVCCIVPEDVPAQHIRADALWKLSKDYAMTAVKK